MKHIKLFEDFKSHSQISQICKKYDINNYTINNDGSIDVKGDVDLSDLSLTKIPLKFRNVYGDFNCGLNILSTLEGAPNYVSGNFLCYSSGLLNLVDFPNIVDGDIDLQWNNLTSLKNLPNKINGDLNIFGNKITSLEGIPSSIGGDFHFHLNNIYSFEYFPDYINGITKFPENLINILNLFDNKQDLIPLFNDYNIIKDPKTPGSKPRLKLSNFDKFLTDNGFNKLTDTDIISLGKIYDLK